MNVFFTLVFAVICIENIIVILIVSNLLQWNLRSQELNMFKLRAFDKTCYNTQCCFYLSWRAELNLTTLRDIVLQNKEQCSSVTNESKHKGNRSDFCKRFVTLESIRGRLGNQMFQVAAVIGAAYNHNMIPVLPKDCLLAEYINLPNAVNKREQLDNPIRYDCKTTAVFNKCPTNILNSNSNITMYGVFQSWLFFEQANYIIRKMFTLKKIHMVKARKFLRESTKSDHKKVCIHVRRGDFTYARHLKRGYSVTNLAFIDRAKKMFLERYSKVQFVVLSNDKEWCIKHIKGDVFSNFTESGDDMALMAQCDNVVVTSGTFGWWGAWLSAGTPVYFKGFPRPGSKLDNRFNRNDYYPSHWIGL